jgi:hypothetical protein
MIKLFKLTHNVFHSPITIIVLAESTEEARTIAHSNTNDKHWLTSSVEEIDITSKGVVALILVG